MHDEKIIRITPGQEYGLFTLRVAVGFLLIWLGVARIIEPVVGEVVSQHLYFGLISDHVLLRTVGGFEACVGLLVLVGLARQMTLPLHFLVTAGTLLTLISGLFGSIGSGLTLAALWQPLYPSIITLISVAVLIQFRDFDRLSLDRWVNRGRPRRRINDDTSRDRRSQNAQA